MRKLVSPFLFLLLLAGSVYGTGDSLHYLTAKDTVFLKVDDLGNKIFNHKLEKGQTLFSLARFYGLKFNTLVQYNPELNLDRPLDPGLEIQIPIPDSAILKARTYKYTRAGYAPVYYMVRQGDTFYRIAKHYFNIPVDSLKNWNRLQTNLLSAGMKLHVGYMSLGGVADSLQWNALGYRGPKFSQLSQQFEYRKANEDPIFQNGAAYWLREKRSTNDLYCLHRNAPVGSVIKIENPMRNRTVYAKVIAPIPDRAYGDDIIIVLSPSVAKFLQARDSKFYVEIYYFKDKH